MKKYAFQLFFCLSIVLTGVFASFALFPDSRIEAASTDNVYGYAWSDTIGWIRFNDCPTPGSSSGCGTNGYGVSIDKTTGNLSGYAWSNSIGWIEFNSGLGGPAGSTHAYGAKLGTNGEITGWAKALGQASGAHGGWSGWISFNCASSGGCSTSNYKTTLATQVGQTRAFSGYAWGSEVVGWIDMTGVTYYVAPLPLPDLTITASPQSVATGGSTTLAWTSTNTTSCEVESGDAVAGWSAGSRDLSKSNPPGYGVSNITSNTVFWLSCYNDDGVKVRKGVLVSVGNPNYSLQTPNPNLIRAVTGSGAGCTASSRTYTRALPHSQFGWPYQVTFTASSPVSGLTYSFFTQPTGGTASVGSIVRSANQGVWIEVDSASALPMGNHTVTVTGSSNGQTRTTAFSLCGDTGSVTPGPGVGTRPKTIFREL